jgi:hypothetical protein
MPPHVFFGLWEHFHAFGHIESAATMRVSTWRFQTKGRPVYVIAMSKPTKRTMLFQCKHALEFSLEIVKFKDKGNTLIVTGMHYVFYMYCG